MNKGDYLEALLRSSQTVFNVKSAMLIWGESDKTIVSNRLFYYASRGKLRRLCYGVYAKDANYSAFELANKIYTPSYITFETVLLEAGIIFQYYESIFVASYARRDIQVDEIKISIRKLKNNLLTNPQGIQHINGYAIATPERAVLDMLYITKDYYFDNLFGLNWELAFSLLPIYENKRLCKTFELLFKEFKEKVQ